MRSQRRKQQDAKGAWWGKKEERAVTKGGRAGPYGRRRRKEMRSGGGTRIGQMKLNLLRQERRKCRYQPATCSHWADMIPSSAATRAKQTSNIKQPPSLFSFKPVWSHRDVDFPSRVCMVPHCPAIIDAQACLMSAADAIISSTVHGASCL